MANLYVKASGSNTSPYDTWAKAATTLLTATAAAAANDTIYMDNAMNDVITVDTTYTLAAGVTLISTSDTTNAPPQTYATGAKVSSTTAGVDITLAATTGRYAVYGMTFAAATGTSTANITLNVTGDGSSARFYDCTFQLAGTGGSSRISWMNNSLQRTHLEFYGCTFLFGSTSQSVNVSQPAKLYNCTFAPTGSVPTTLFTNLLYVSYTYLEGCDLSTCSGTLFAAAGDKAWATLVNCSLHTSATIINASNTDETYLEANLYNCNAGDNHYAFAHYNGLGSTTISTSIYANDGAQYDGSNRLSWVVAGTSNATYSYPYISPWIDVYHSGTSAITPYLECVRSGSSTAYNDDEVWSEWSYQGTAGSSKASFVNDKRALLGSAAAQTSSSKTGSDWTGENATSWFGKLSPTSTITPAEIGYIRARVCVAGNHTVYVDPQIRGLT